MNLIRCSRCVMPSTRPDTPFVNGVCSACLSYERRPTIDWAARKQALVDLLDRHNGQCIVPSSGGKDSTYQVMTLLEMGADVTVVTARTCHLTDLGRQNIDNLARHARTIEVVPNMTVRAKLNRLGLQMVGDISWPEHAAIFSTPFNVSADLGVPLVFYGENPQDQYGGPLGSEEAKQLTLRWRSEFGGFLGLRPSDFVGQSGITSKDMRDYTVQHIDYPTECHFLGQYIQWDSHHNAAVAMAAGMKAILPTGMNWWKWENLDNAQTGLHDYVMWLKYGFGRGCQQISVDVRTGRVDRHDALEWINYVDRCDNWSADYAGVNLVEVLDRIWMTTDQLMNIFDQFKNKAIHDAG